MLPKIIPFTNEHNYLRICRYLLLCTLYSTDAEEHQDTLKVIYDIYMTQSKYSEALVIAPKYHKPDLINVVMKSCADRIILKQMAIMIGCHKIPYTSEDEEIKSIFTYDKLFEYFQVLAKDLEVMDPKGPEDIFKLHLEERKGNAIIDSAKYNLARAYVNGFVNACFGKGKLLTPSVKSADEWIYKNKEIGITVATASLGLIKMWGCSKWPF